MIKEIGTYIIDARAKNFSDEQIKSTLLAAGWSEGQITEAFTQRPLETPIAPPPPVPHIGMWIGFLYILFFISLYVLATVVGVLFHDMVEHVIVDAKTATYSYHMADNTSMVRGALAAIIVSFPLFAILALILKKQISKQPAIINIRSRKLLIYITLIGTFLIMLGHIIYSLYSFLDGKLTTNALGHLFVTFLIAGSIFGYFLSEVIYDRKTQ
jgi:hypothetical protein